MTSRSVQRGEEGKKMPEFDEVTVEELAKEIKKVYRIPHVIAAAILEKYEVRRK